MVAIPAPGAAAPDGSDRRTMRVPRGLLILPFGIGVAITLLVALAMRDTITLGWLAAAAVIGIMLAALVLATQLAGGHPAKVAHARTGVRGKAHHEAMGGDPLAHIHAVEAQGRRHTRACVNCGTRVKAGQAQCPNCGQLQVFACKGCKTQVRLDWSQCPECGRPIP